MRIFISWSGKRSKYIATALREWLPNVLQAVIPFISTQDISKGSRGNVKITKELEESSVGVVCLTPENLNSPWILFEAGALSKLEAAYVCTYLYDLDAANVPPPLGQFQHTRTTKDDTLSLITTISAELPEDRKLDGVRLKAAFETWWPKLEGDLKEMPERPGDEALPEQRSEEDKLDEMLKLLRDLGAKKAGAPAYAASRGFQGPTVAMVFPPDAGVSEDDIREVMGPFKEKYFVIHASSPTMNKFQLVFSDEDLTDFDITLRELRVFAMSYGGTLSYG